MKGLFEPIKNHILRTIDPKQSVRHELLRDRTQAYNYINKQGSITVTLNKDSKIYFNP